MNGPDRGAAAGGAVAPDQRPRPADRPSWASRLPARLRSWWGEGVEAIASMVLPFECPVCGAEVVGSGAPFCGDCRSELLGAAGGACPRCAMPVGPWGVCDRGCGECLGRRLGFDAAVALGPYQGPIRDLCLRLKHLPNAWVGPWLGALVAEARPALAAEASASPGARVVPVPLHWSRRWQRGYNQAEELARGLADRLGLRLSRPLYRRSRTAALARLGRTERARIVRDAFGLRRGGARGLVGRTVFLVDDILTTGATCGAAARALKRAGASRVVAVVVGRAGGGF